MGDPRKLRNKYERPKRLWDVDRIKHDTALRKEYGLKNASEVWRATAELKKYRREARRLLSLTEEERKEDSERILSKLNRMSILPKGASVEDVLSLEVKDVLERRLQTIVFRKGLARTMRQARQLITHGFISLDGRKVTAPSYLVDAKKAETVKYAKAIDITVRELLKEEETAEEEETKPEAPAKEEKPAEAGKPAPSSGE